MIPVIPILSGCAFLCSIVTLGWYSGLSEENQSAFDELIGQYAWRLYQTSVDKLSEAQRSEVVDLARDHWNV